MFTKLLILGKCHYFGYLHLKGKKVKEEIKGIQIKRSSSSKYEVEFQRILINKILDKIPKDKMLDWLKEEQEKIKNLPLSEIAFPCKIANTKYKYEPIFVRAYNNTRQIEKKFKLNKGEIFYYIYINNMGYDKNGKPINVIALSDKYDFIIDKKNIDWNEMIRRNITKKVDTIFEILGWGKINELLSNQLTLF